MSRIGNLSSRIFVGGLDPVVDESDLEKAFALFGEITNVMVMRDRDNGRSRGFAFISFKDSMSSEDAISRMHGVEIRGRCVTVRHAERERFLDDKNQTGSAGSMRGKSGPVTNMQSRDSQYSGYKAHPSKIVFVTDDDQDYSRGSSYKHRRSLSPGGNPAYSANVGSSNNYRERSPHYRYDNQNAQRAQRSYYEDNSNTSGRLSPTEELSAYVNSRYRGYSPQPEFTKAGRTNSTDYHRSERGNQKFYHSHDGQRSGEHERSSYDQKRQYRDSNKQRSSPDMYASQKSQGSYDRISRGQDYTDSQRRNDFRDERRPRNPADSRRSASGRISPERLSRNRNYGRNQSPDRDTSWERNKPQRTSENSYRPREWDEGASKSFRDQRRDRVNDNFQRDRNQDFQRSRRSDASEYGKSDNNSNGGGSRWNRDNRESSSYPPKSRSYDWKGQQREPRQDRGVSSTQSWKRESSGFDRSKDFRRAEDHRSTGNYQRKRYQDEDKEQDRRTDTYHDGSGTSQSGRGRYQNSRGRRY